MTAAATLASLKPGVKTGCRPPSQRGHVAYPFYYLQSEGFWHLLPRPGQAAVLAARLDGELSARYLFALR